MSERKKTDLWLLTSLVSVLNTELGRKRHHIYHILASYSQWGSTTFPTYYRKVPRTILFPITAAKSGFHCTLCCIQNGTQKFLYTQFQFAAALKSYVCKGTDESIQSLKGLLELTELCQKHWVQVFGPVFGFTNIPHGT